LSARSNASWTRPSGSQLIFDGLRKSPSFSWTYFSSSLLLLVVALGDVGLTLVLAF